MSARWKWASPFKPPAAKLGQGKEGVSSDKPNDASAPLSSSFTRASARNEPETRSEASSRPSRSSSDVARTDVVQSAVNRATPSLQVISARTPPTGSLSAACPSASRSTSTLIPASSGLIHDGASRRKARLRSPRTGGPLRPFGGKPSAEMLDEVLGFKSTSELESDSPVSPHALAPSCETAPTTPINGQAAVISQHRAVSYASLSSSATSTSRGAGSSTTSFDQASASPRSACSAAASSVPTTVDATSPRSSRVDCGGSVADASSDLHPALTRSEPPQVPRNAGASGVRSRPPTPSGSAASRSLRKAFRMGSSRTSTFDLAPTMALSDDQIHKPLRKASVSSLWSKLSISRKSSRASLRRAMPTPGVPLQHTQSLSSIRRPHFVPVEERLSEKSRKSSSSSGSSSLVRRRPLLQRIVGRDLTASPALLSQISRHDLTMEMMSFYEAAAADRIYPKQPLLSLRVDHARRHVSKDLPARPPSERTLPPRPPSGLSSSSPTERAFDVNARPSRERLANSLVLPSSALSKKAKRRSILSVKDLPPPAPPPTGPLPPTPTGPPAPSPLGPGDDDDVREPSVAVRDSLEDLYSSSNLFYGRDDDNDLASLPDDRSQAVR